MGLVQRETYTGEMNGQEVRVSACFVHKRANPDKKSTLSFLIKRLQTGEEVSSGTIDVTGDLILENGEKDEFRKRTADYLQDENRGLLIKEKSRREPLTPAEV